MELSPPLSLLGERRGVEGLRAGLGNGRGLGGTYGATAPALSHIQQVS